MIKKTMKCRATLKTDSRDAESVSMALGVDNTGPDGLVIKTSGTGGKIVTEVASESLPTLINTLDDIICCQMAAERMFKK